MRKPIAVFLFLSGCAAPMTQERAQQIANTYSPICEALGHIKGSEPWARCIVAAYEMSNNNSNIFANSLGRGLQGAGGTLSPDVYNAQRGLPPAPPASYNTNCTRDSFGNVNCTTRPSPY